MTPSTRPAALTGLGADSPAQLAKAALRRLAADRLEPTPENYARAYRLEGGDAAAAQVVPERALRLIERLALRAFDGDAETGATAAAGFGQALGQGRWEQAERALEALADAGAATPWAGLLERIVRGVERSGRNWTAGRKKESLQRVLGGSRSDARRLQQRLTQLVGSWETDSVDGGDIAAVGAAVAAIESDTGAAAVTTAPLLPWERAVDTLGASVRLALPQRAGTPHPVAVALAALGRRIVSDGATAERIDELAQLCERADGVLQQRHRLHDDISGLCTELTESLTDLAENDSWARGQCDAMRVRIDEGLSARGVRAVSDLLRTTRERQNHLRGERERARDSLKTLINRMLSELDELGSQTGHFHDSVGRYADVIGKADSLESLAGVVREMVEESRTVQALVQQTQQRLRDEHQKASGLTRRVGELENEMKRLSDEVATDQLTQIANRRGLAQAFDAEQSRMHEDGNRMLAIGLLDIDNFKRLNDELGHSAGDEALKSLAAVVSCSLRSTDVVARYGGEEFVVLLPQTGIDEGERILTALQRSLSGGLFMHQDKQVFVTFSAGITAYRPDERMEAALERADQALYEAKRSGKNKTCAA